MHLDLEKLRTFVEVVRTGNYTSAARNLHITPSAISHALGKLQGNLASPLLVWRGRRLTLTDSGRHLYQACQRAFAEIEEADRRVTSGAAEVAQDFILGATIEFGTTVLLQKLRPFLDKHPALHVDFRFANELTKPLLRDEIDLAVDCRPHPNPAVGRVQMFREKYVVVASPAFLAQRPIRSPLDLGQAAVVSLDAEGVWWNNFLQSVAANRRPVLAHVTVIDDVRGMILAALAGYGVALVPKYAVINELGRGSLTVLFARLKLLEDSFCIYQKLAHAERPANRLVTQFLLGIDVHELGDAIGL